MKLTLPYRWKATLKKRLPSVLDDVGLAALCLDSSGKVTKSYQIAVGSLNQCLVSAEDVFGGAVRSRRAAGLVLVRVRPRGSKPGQSELAEALRLKREGDLCGVRLIRQVSAEQGRWSSLR